MEIARQSVDGSRNIRLRLRDNMSVESMEITPALESEGIAEFVPLGMNLAKPSAFPEHVAANAQDPQDTVIHYDPDCQTCYQRPDGSIYCRGMC